VPPAAHAPADRPAPTPTAAAKPAARRRYVPLPVALAACTAFLLLTMIAGIAIGSVPLSPGAVLAVIWAHLAGHHPGYSVTDAIVWDIRFPGYCWPRWSARR
jgi:ABC-type Fe3+-siderophore transport system permease subunit